MRQDGAGRRIRTSQDERSSAGSKVLVSTQLARCSSIASFRKTKTPRKTSAPIGLSRQAFQRVLDLRDSLDTGRNFGRLGLPERVVADCGKLREFDLGQAKATAL